MAGKKSAKTWVPVADGEDEEPVELQCEPDEDNALLLTTVSAQFPGATGIKFKNPDTGGFRGVRLVNGRLLPPDDEDGWGKGVIYYCVKPKRVQLSVENEASTSGAKRKSPCVADDMASPIPAKKAAVGNEEEDQGEEDEATNEETTDLIVLGLPYKADEDLLRAYFEKLGEVSMVQLKCGQNGNSKGFAFVRFKSVEVQRKVLLTRHEIGNRWCDVKIPDSQQQEKKKVTSKVEDCKIFVARLTQAVSEEDVKSHFSTFGEVTDVFYPTGKTFRGFSFVTFKEAKVAQSLIGKDHDIKGVSVHIGSATPKQRDGGGGGSSQYRQRWGGSSDHVGGNSGGQMDRPWKYNVWEQRDYSNW